MSLQDAIDRAKKVLWSSYREDGSWDERSDVGPSSTANVLVALHHVGLLPASELARGAQWLRSQQRKDGSFVAYPFAKSGDVSVTAQCWAALHLDRESKDAAEKAAKYVRAHGGVDARLAAMGGGDLSPIYLALVGLLDPERLPCPPALWALSDRVVDWLSKRVHFGFIMGALQLSMIAQRLRGKFGRDGTDRSWLERRECARAVELMLIYQNADGSWNSNTVQTAMALPALVAAGLSKDDERVQRAARWLESRKVDDGHGGLWFDVFSSDIWTTAFNARALILAGESPADPRFIKSYEWLLDRQLEVPQPKPNNRREGALRTGGWPFQTGNETMADCDDAGIVLSVLALALEPDANGQRIPDALADRIRTAVRKARPWLRDMQNPDGGWPAFVWSLPAERPQRTLYSVPIELSPTDPIAALKTLFDAPPELGDPSTEDLTARVLHGLGSHGATTKDPEVSRAIAFLREHQTDFGGWWGRWVCNYLASTAYVLAALAKVKDDVEESFIERAIHFVLSRQNADGGWGESTASYTDASKAGKGPSTVPLTSLVLGALVEIGRGNDPAIAKGVQYLLKKQRSDGTWPNDDYVATNIPPLGFYFYGGAVRHMPLEALARYARRHEQQAIVPAQSFGRWTSALLDGARTRTDPEADAVVAAIFEAGKIEKVNQLLASILENDDPVPPGLPQVAVDYFERTAELPPWADEAKILRAQEIFHDFGVYITFGFFCSSLPQAYAAAHGAEVLVQTGAMLDRVRQRVFETAQFLFDVLDVGSLDPQGRGIRSAQRVRLMHAAIRHLIAHHPRFVFDTKVLGQPINQEDKAGTLMTFSIVTIEAAQRLGVTITKSDADAWIHHWAVVGHLIGLEDDLLPRDAADAARLMEAIRERQWAPSPRGRALTLALVEMMQEFFTRDVDALDGLTPSLIRHLAGDRCADLHDLPRSDWTMLLIRALESATDAIDDGDRDTFLEQGLGEIALRSMRWITEVERKHKSASFRVPASLKKTVGV